MIKNKYGEIKLTWVILIENTKAIWINGNSANSISIKLNISENMIAYCNSLLNEVVESTFLEMWTVQLDTDVDHLFLLSLLQGKMLD